VFERYTEKARCVILFAREEAGELGVDNIEAEHVLLGLIRENKEVARRIESGGGSEASIRSRIQKHRPAGKKIPGSVDLPLSQESKRVLAYAAEEAGRLSLRHIGTEHLLLGLLREKKCVAARILGDCHFDLTSLRGELNPFQEDATNARRHEKSPLAD
jgi:ATP-dependent Clp protease ATP-binding subunit ClpC